MDEDLSPVNILLVDDNVANLMALEAVLEPLGQRLVRALSGAEAIDKLHELDFALVLMDVHMPMLDGFQTVEVIRKRELLRHMPVMFLTALFRDEKSVARGYSLGAVDFITKPFDPDIIRAKVGAFVALHQRNETIKQQERRIGEEVAARRLAEISERAKEELIAVLGHDLRNPLNAILMTAAQLEHDAHAPDPYRRGAERIARSARRMSRLILDIVEFARSRFSGWIPAARQPADMAELCRLPIEEAQVINPDCRVELVMEGDLHGEWDPARIGQLVANLIDNAIKHSTERNGGVQVTLRGEADAVVLAVHNCGDVIPAERMAHLFEPFQRRAHRREGLGLGLYIVGQIARAHAGSVSVESTESEGTTFTVRLPRNAEARQSEHA